MKSHCDELKNLPFILKQEKPFADVEQGSDKGLLFEHFTLAVVRIQGIKAKSGNKAQ